ncbi:MAG: 16S rRNA (guanine(527)-N(7))-methyltransferase RsmG [Leptolyngbya sp. SIOISBB]|nr:16S rRNA (guanine(527)-N(7))-methyltransferase RsmG [Leptolyngbya sp. SIOISBB]
MSSLPDFTKSWQATLQWQPTPEQQTLFQQLFQAILMGNQQMNLTRITEPTEFWEKHLWDALSGLAPWLSLESPPDWLPSQLSLRAIDIGTGAGIPGFPAAIALPDWHITLLDATQKKVRFLQELAQTISLNQVKAIADRAEFLAHQPSHREQYDVAMLRAVGSAATCAEYALPLLKLGGIAILYRGQWSDEDSQQLDRVAARLGGQLVDVRSWQTPITQGMRHCLYLQKQRITSEDFPRAAGIPAKTPLTA